MKILPHYVFLLTLVIAISGCSQQSPQKAAEEKYEKSLGVTVQKHGLMSSSEWVELHRLSKTATVNRKLDDEDFQHVTDLVQQKASSLSPATSPVAVHLTAMNIFQNMTRASPAQKSKIISVVTPLLSSPSRYERIMAKQVVDEFKGTS